MPTIDIGIIEKLDYKRDYANWDRFESYKHMIKFYRCISIEDDDLLGLIHETFEKKLPVSYCEVENKHNTGIDWAGITLISPNFIRKLIDIIKSNESYRKFSWYIMLLDKCNDALSRNKYMIFFGI